jgi:hypothetical protein
VAVLPCCRAHGAVPGRVGSHCEHHVDDPSAAFGSRTHQTPSGSTNSRIFLDAACQQVNHAPPPPPPTFSPLALSLSTWRCHAHLWPADTLMPPLPLILNTHQWPMSWCCHSDSSSAFPSSQVGPRRLLLTPRAPQRMICSKNQCCGACSPSHMPHKHRLQGAWLTRGAVGRQEAGAAPWWDGTAGP